MYVGMDEQSPRSWKIWNPTTRQFIYTASVIFDEVACGKEGFSTLEEAARQEGLDKLFVEDIPELPSDADADATAVDAYSALIVPVTRAEYEALTMTSQTLLSILYLILGAKVVHGTSWHKGSVSTDSKY
jgi:hypothetical protein